MKCFTLTLKTLGIVLLLSANCFALDIAPQTNSDFYILENHGFKQITCDIRPTAAKKYLNSLKDGSANDSVKYSVTDTMKDYKFTLSNNGTIQISPTKLTIDIYQTETTKKAEKEKYVAAMAWKIQTEKEYQNLIRFSSSLVEETFRLLQPNEPEGKIISRREKDGVLTLRYASIFSKTIRSYKQTDKGGLLTKSFSELTDFKKILSRDTLSISYQQLKGLFIPKKASRSLFINKSVDGKMSTPQDIVIEFEKCTIEK